MLSSLSSRFASSLSAIGRFLSLNERRAPAHPWQGRPTGNTSEPCGVYVHEGAEFVCAIIT